MSIKLNMSHIKTKKQTFDGIYRGVIEDNNDPDKLGRVRVRIFGIHSSIKNKLATGGIPVDELPWAEPCFSLLGGSVSGIGTFSVPVNGSHVLVFFEGGNWECVRYFATLPGNPVEKADITQGFNDPDGIYPLEDHLSEPDTHRLARNEKISETIVQDKIDDRTTGIPKAGGGTWDEPLPSYAAQYPKNTVICVESGITIELDSTPNSSRIHIYHPSGSFVEINNSGDVVFKNAGDRFDISKGNKYETSVENHINTTGDSSINSGAKWTVKATGDIKIETAGTLELTGATILLNGISWNHKHAPSTSPPTTI